VGALKLNGINMIFKEISLNRGTKNLLINTSITLPNQARVAIIGRNGAGKSSLFAAIQGRIHFDSGTLELPNQTTMASLSQSLPDQTITPLQHVCAGDKRWVAIKAKIDAAEASNDGEAIANAYGELEPIDGYTLESRAAALLQGLGFSTEQIHQPLSSFSGGWQMRAQLAHVLIAPSSLLLLDEPTNHLDLESVTFLQHWLQSYRGLALIISHDRSFLDEVSTHTLHLAQQILTLYSGNYSSFAKQFQEALELQSKMAKKVEAKRAHMQSFVDRFRAKATKAKQAQGRLKALEKLQFSETLVDEHAFHFSFLPTKPATYPMIKMDADCGYGDKVILKNIGCTLSPQDRIGIIGVNGAGKSTFLKSLAKTIPLIQGEVIHAQGLSIGFYTQQQVENLDLDATPLDVMQDHFPHMDLPRRKSFLGQFNFTFDQMNQQIADFSGGERARLALACLVQKQPQLLILDEPTNHLDMQMREALIEALQSYEGAVLLVSHDRHLLECVTDQFIIIAHHHLHTYEGSLDDYAQTILQSTQKPKAVKEVAEKKGSKKKRKASQSETLERLDKKISLCETKLKQVDADIVNKIEDKADQTEINKLTTKRGKLEKNYETLQNEWLMIAEDE
jgi:ATP-binding cassette subfamily F protein 3